MSETGTSASWRAIAYRAFVAIFVLGMVLSTTAIWANIRIQDSDSWAETVGPLADDPEIQAFVIEQTSALIEQQIAADEDAGALWNFTRSQLNALVRVALNDFVSSPTFSTWWTEANRGAHRILMEVMTERENDLLNTYGGDLILNLQPAVDWVNGHIEGLFPDAGYSISLPPESSVIVLYSSDALESTTRIMELVDTLAFVLPIMTIVALAAAIGAAWNRLDAIKHIGLLLAIGMVILLVLLSFVRIWFVSNQDAAVRDVLDAMIRIVLIDLTSAFRVLALGGLVVAGLIAALQSKYARNPRVRAFLREHREVLAGAAISLAVLAIVMTEYPPLWLSLGALVVTVGGVVLLLRWRGATPAFAEPGDAPSDTS